ncbi:MAG TPA: cupin domain-containing protein [Flavisolibacter sp.]|nr:cupin domain-containing protein [Flavisolibacter sp.]
MNAEYLVNQLQLLPHPEGGFYKETYRSNEGMDAHCLPQRFGGERSFSTAIYFLLRKGEFSAFHRIKSDEGWHFYAGGGLRIHVIDAEGNYSFIRLGAKLDEGEVFQAVVPAGCWFASEPEVGTEFSLVGCTVSPGFDFADFEMAGVAQLSKEFPQHSSLISRLCRL